MTELQELLQDRVTMKAMGTLAVGSFLVSLIIWVLVK